MNATVPFGKLSAKWTPMTMNDIQKSYAVLLKIHRNAQADPTIKDPSYTFRIIWQSSLTICTHSCDTMLHFYIPVEAGYTGGPECQKASNSISPSPRLSLPSRLSCLGMCSGERQVAGLEICDCTEMGIVPELPPVSEPDPPGWIEVKLLRLVQSGDISSVLVLRKFRIGSSVVLVIWRLAANPFWLTTTSRKEARIKCSRRAIGSVFAQ